MNTPTGLVIRGNNIAPPWLLAPMAGVTHSAYRRLVADIGGYGALFTEMLSGTALYCENTTASPFTKRRDHEGRVFYQLRLTGSEDLKRILDVLSRIDLFAIDINLGCPAPEIRKRGAGGGLFEDFDRLKGVLESMRSLWGGLLTVKCRLGNPCEAWQEKFSKRMQLFETVGIDAVTVHPRFSDEKLKRSARNALYPWIVRQTKLPVIANGDILTVADANRLLQESGCKAVMIGRMAAVQPWIFRELSSGKQNIDYSEIWNRLFEYTCEDFPATKAIGRIKEFTAYYSRNFKFGHQLYKGVQGAIDLEVLKKRANDFLSANPEIETAPTVMGI